jgi:phage terminase small subunit
MASVNDKALIPKHLSAEARRLWRTLRTSYVFAAPGSLLLLASLVEAWDRARQCRAELQGQPLTVRSRRGAERVHPLVIEERQARDQVTRLCRVLRIHLDDLDEADDAEKTVRDS